MKKVIRLTENEINNIVSNTVKSVLKEANSAYINRKYINLLYKTIERSGLTSQLFNDDYWLGKDKICELIENIDGVTDFKITVDNGGYRQNKDGDAHWKEYKLLIEFENLIVINGILNCHGAGTIEDPFSRYDITVSFW